MKTKKNAALVATCPDCQHDIAVTLGRKSPTPRLKCRFCGGRYDYLVWAPQEPGGEYQVHVFPNGRRVDIVVRRVKV
jgi:transcription elongation factor Elf1